MEKNSIADLNNLSLTGKDITLRALDYNNGVLTVEELLKLHGKDITKRILDVARTLKAKERGELKASPRHWPRPYLNVLKKLVIKTKLLFSKAHKAGQPIEVGTPIIEKKKKLKIENGDYKELRANIPSYSHLDEECLEVNEEAKRLIDKSKGVSS